MWSSLNLRRLHFYVRKENFQRSECFYAVCVDDFFCDDIMFTFAQRARTFQPNLVAHRQYTSLVVRHEPRNFSHFLMILWMAHYPTYSDRDGLVHLTSGMYDSNQFLASHARSPC